MAIQIRRGTDAEWESNKSNIVAGEPAVAMDTERMFIGTGSGTYMEVANIEVLADAFDSSASYVVGDFVSYHGKVYKCNTDHSGAWNASHFDEVALVDALDALTDDIKQALLQLASKVAYIDDDGQDYYDALESALYHDATLVSISAVYTQGGTVYDTDSLDSLKDDLVVTATYSDSSTETVTAYTLSGTLEVGTSTITVAYGGKTTTFSVTVTSFGFLYTPSQGLLSAQSYVSSVTSPENVSESLENGYLKLFLQAKSADNQVASFNFTELAGNSFHIRAKVMAVSMGSNSNKWNQGPFRFSVVNGSVWSTSGLNNNNGYRVRYVKSNWECEDSSFTFAANTWVTLDVVLSNGTVTIKLDDATVVSNLVLPTNSATVTRLDVQRQESACEFLVDSIEFTR